MDLTGVLGLDWRASFISGPVIFAIMIHHDREPV